MTSSARRALRLLVPATLLAVLVVAAVLTLSGTVTAPAQAATRVDRPTAVAPLLPALAFPDLQIPDVPLPRASSSEASDTPTVRLTCEPWADARMDDPAHPNWITNKDCPDLIAAKERAQREFRDQLDREAAARTDSEVGDWRESACSDPSSSVYGTATCGADLEPAAGAGTSGTSG